MIVLFEGIVAAFFGTPFFGYLTSAHGYDIVRAKEDGNVTGVDEEQRKKNVVALSKSLTSVVIICWTIAFIIWSFMYCTYPSDKAEADRYE